MLGWPHKCSSQPHPLRSWLGRAGGAQEPVPGSLLSVILPQVVGSMHLSSLELEAADTGPPGSRPFPGDPKLCAQGWAVERT